MPDDTLCVAGNDRSVFIFFHYLHKRGWNFTDDDLQPHVLDSLRRQGAAYLYSDSRATDENPEIQARFEKPVGRCGSISVVKLKN